MEVRFAVRASGSKGLPSAFLLFLAFNAVRGAEVLCPAPTVDCGYFGCFPPASECPPDCDTFEVPETCHAVRTADGRQACRFNPQYSFGKGLCQKYVTCYDLGNGECSDDCFHCRYFGCLPSGTNCPAYCDKFGSLDCESMGGVAGGLACQWNSISEICEAVPLARLNRALYPPPLLAHPALTVGGGVPVTPPGLPTGPPAPEPLDWAGAQGSAGRQAFYVGAAFGLFGLVSVSAFLCRQRALEAKRKRTLAGPALLHHRESFLAHIRRAVTQVGPSGGGDGAQRLASSAWPPPGTGAPSSPGAPARPVAPGRAGAPPPGSRPAPHPPASSLLPRKPSVVAPVDVAIKSSASTSSGVVGRPLHAFAEDPARTEQFQRDDDLLWGTEVLDNYLKSP